GMVVGFNGPTPGCMNLGWSSDANGIAYNANVGIGMGSVNTNKLHVLVDAGISNGIILNTSASGSGTLLGLNDQGVPRFSVQQNGNVGIGTNAPSNPLEIVKSGTGVQPLVYLKN